MEGRQWGGWLMRQNRITQKKRLMRENRITQRGLPSLGLQPSSVLFGK